MCVCVWGGGDLAAMVQCSPYYLWCQGKTMSTKGRPCDTAAMLIPGYRVHLAKLLFTMGRGGDT